MFSRFENLEEKLLELEQKLADPSQLSNQEEFGRLAKEHAHVTKLHQLYLSFKQTEQELADSNEMIKIEEDEEMQEMGRADISELTLRLASLEHELQLMLIPKNHQGRNRRG
jgi:peptide chain release factor 1